MTRNWHIMAQFLLILLNLFSQTVAPQLMPFIEEQYHGIFHATVSFCVGAVQAGLALWAHGLDVDGKKLGPVPQEPPND